MTHPRKAIRDAAQAALINKTKAGAKVFVNRVQPFVSNGWLNQLPAIVIYTMEESAEIFNAAPREYERTLQLMVEIQGSASEELDDVLDEISEEVERILLRDDTLGGTVNDLVLARTRMVIREEGDTLIGACIIQFDAEYMDRRPDDAFNETLPPLDSVDTEYSLSNAQPDYRDRAKTLIEGL